MTEPSTQAKVTTDDFRGLMAQFPTGVAIVTTTDLSGRPWGMTCSSLCSVTLTPPTLLVCLRDGSPTLDALRQRGSFTVNLLHDGAKPVAELFASGAPDRFDLVRWANPPAGGGPHLSLATHAIADCRLTHAQRVGDHVLVLGETFAVARRTGHVPLLYGRRQYRSWPDLH